MLKIKVQQLATTGEYRFIIKDKDMRIIAKSKTWKTKSTAKKHAERLINKIRKLEYKFS